MKVEDERRQLALPPSGFGLLGPRLFADRPLGDILKEQSADRVLKATSWALAATPFSKLRVRRALVKASSAASPIDFTGDPNVTKTQHWKGLRFSAVFTFTGDANLLRAEAAGMPNRVLKARIKDNQLIIDVRSPACDEFMVPYAIASEILSIRKVLADQRATINQHNREQAAYWAMFVEENWDALCQMRPAAQNIIDAWAIRTRRELLELHDMIYETNKFADEDAFFSEPIAATTLKIW
jgi:hypothetical protein